MENLKTIRPLSYVAGWSSLVARQAHNLKVLGSNPSPAPNFHRGSTWQREQDIGASWNPKRI